MSNYLKTIGEIAQVFDGPHATPEKTDFGPFFLSISSLGNGALDLSKSAHLSEKDFGKWTKRVTPQEGDVLFSYETRLGEAALMPGGIKACLGRRMGLLRADRSKVLPEYLLYAYLSPEFQEIIRANTIHGATVDRIALKDLPNYPIRIPPLAEQIKVVGVLKGIFRKKELNTQTSQTLEQIAQAIFKSWFVDFDPVKAKIAALEAGGTQEAVELAAMCVISGKDEEQLAQLKIQDADAYQQLAQTAALFPAAMQESELGEIPEDWRVKVFDDVCFFQNGFAFSSKDLTTDKAEGTHKVFKMGNIKKGGGFNSAGSKDYFDVESNPKVSRYLIKKGDLLMCMTDMKNNVALLGHTALMPITDQYLVNQRVGLIRKSESHYLDYPFFYFQTNEENFIQDVRSRANSGVQVNLSTQGIKETLLVVPPESVHYVFNNVVKELLESIFLNDFQSENLSELRDSLLPKLLSGEIDLSDIQSEVA